MSPEISKHVFKEAVECGLLRHGPDACRCAANAVPGYERDDEFSDVLIGAVRT